MRLNQPIYLPDFMIVLYYLGDKLKHTITKISNDNELTYPHVFKMKKVFLKRGWITIEKIGKRHEIQITDKGLEVVTTIKKLMDLFNITEEELRKIRIEGKYKNKLDKSLKEDIEKKQIEEHIPKQSFDGIKLEEDFKKDIEEGKIENSNVPDEILEEINNEN